MTNEYRCFLKSNFVGLNRSFVLVSLNQDNDPKRFKTQRYYLPKRIMSSSIKKTFITKQFVQI